MTRVIREHGTAPAIPTQSALHTFLHPPRPPSSFRSTWVTFGTRTILPPRRRLVIATATAADLRYGTDTHTDVDRHTCADLRTCVTHSSVHYTTSSQVGCHFRRQYRNQTPVGQGRGGTASPHFFRQGGRVPHSPHFFWTEIRAKVSPLLQLVTY